MGPGPHSFQPKHQFLLTYILVVRKIHPAKARLQGSWATIVVPDEKRQTQLVAHRRVFPQCAQQIQLENHPITTVIQTTEQLRRYRHQTRSVS